MYSQQFRYQPAGINQTMLESLLAFLKQLNSNELESLEKDEARIHKFVEDCEQVRQLHSEKENLMASNKSLAEYNLTRESRLEQARGQLAHTHEQAVEVSKSFDRNKMLLEAVPTKNSSDVQLALLQTECAKTEEVCENLAEEFLDKKLDIDLFLPRYIEQRTLSHIRKVKCEKMAELLRGGSGSGRTPLHQQPPVPQKKHSLPSQPFAPSYSAYINTGVAPYLPYPVQSSSYQVPAYQGQPSYSMPTPYPSHPGTFPQPNLH